MEATVFTDPETSEPKILTNGEKLDLEVPVGLGWADYHIVSQYSLEAAVAALQHIKRNSRCHMARVVAQETLRVIGLTGDLPTDPDGMPEQVKLVGTADNAMLVDNYYRP
jgi:hypothetical protein